MNNVTTRMIVCGGRNFGNERNVLADHIPAEYIKPFVRVKDLQRPETLFKGIFWIVDTENLENNAPYLFKIVTNRNGDILAAYGELTSKKGDNYNHRLTWNDLPREFTDNKPYNYYPRGRVEIKNDVAKIFINPLLNDEEIIDYIKKEFGLNENSIGSIKVLVDNSQHYSISGGR